MRKEDVPKLIAAAESMVVTVRGTGYCPWCDRRQMGGDAHEPDCEIGVFARNTEDIHVHRARPKRYVR